MLAGRPEAEKLDTHISSQGLVEHSRNQTSMDDTIVTTESSAHMNDRYDISNAEHRKQLHTDSFRLIVLGK